MRTGISSGGKEMKYTPIFNTERGHKDKLLFQRSEQISPIRFRTDLKVNESVQSPNTNYMDQSPRVCYSNSQKRRF